MEQNLNISLEMDSDIVYRLLTIAKEKEKTLSALVNEISYQYLLERNKHSIPDLELAPEEQGRAWLDERSEKEGRERRQLPRQQVNIPALLKIDYQQGEINSLLGETQDISASGINLKTSAASAQNLSTADKDLKFRVAFRLPNEANDIVLICKPHRMEISEGSVQIGASFEDVSYYDLVKLYSSFGWQKPPSI
ncbi:MAG: PilZ domain-containing protein [Syntrophales bacterium LBB04]|nr:PilZ domain-containing protein [Syntrophales bacterium LBB04]